MLTLVIYKKCGVAWSEDIVSFEKAKASSSEFVDVNLWFD